jgi:hypothetical protein
VGWDTLEWWGDDVVRVAPLTGAVGVDHVWSVRVGGQLAVGRLGRRGEAVPRPEPGPSKRFRRRKGKEPRRTHKTPARHPQSIQD